MTSEGSPPTLQRPGDSDAFPNPLAAHLETGDAVSILSSRMTDVASDDGGERAVDSAASVNQRHSKQLPTGEASRPTTAATGISSQRDTLSRATSSRRGYVSPASAQRASQSTGLATTASGRPPSSTSRTHVPSLTSHAFFRPMSSQRLQAQRGGSRPATMSQQGLSEDGSVEGSIVGQAVPQEASTFDDSELQRPHSRGTQMTEQETSERITANTSPTNGHNAAESTSESVRPLQRNNTNPKGLSINLDKSYKSGGGLPTPSKSPHSFRSGFLLPARGDIAPSSPNRSAHGREKLSSVASSPAFTPTNLAKVVSGPKLGSNYQYFTGNTVFCWGGRLQNTRHRPINIATGLIVTIPSVLFYIFSAPWLWHNVSPAIPIVFAYIFYITMSSFIHASVSDPGILPRNLHPMPPPEESEDLLRLAPSMNDWTMIKSATSATAAMEVPTKYCKTCNIWRPPRGHHCRICDNCIETQDHHCVWLNNCIGRRNYRYFFTFVTAGTLTGIYVFAASLSHVLLYRNRHHISFGAAINDVRVPFAMAIYALIVTPYTTALCVYHLLLMGRGETTREYLNSHKFPKKDRHRPFTQGQVLKNWLVVLCRPRPPTYLNFKKKYEQGDQRFGEKKGNRTAPLAKEVQGGKGVALEMQNVTSGERGFQGPSVLKGNGV